MNYLKKVLNHFWQHWIREYLLELRNIDRLKSRALEEQKICVGDVGIVHDDNRRRAPWKLGKVQGLITGQDLAIRGAAVKVTEGRGRTSLLRRLMQKLYPLQRGAGGASQELPQEPQQSPVNADQRNGEGPSH